MHNFLLMMGINSDNSGNIITQDLNVKLKETYQERDKLAMRLVKSEGAGTRVKLLESELKETKQKLSESLVKSELACGQVSSLVRHKMLAFKEV